MLRDCEWRALDAGSKYLFFSRALNHSQIASLVGDLNVLSLEPYKHLRVERLRGRQDAHLDEARAALAALQKSARNHEAFFARASESRMESKKERDVAGDFSTPMERIHAAVTAEAVIQKAASAKKK